MDVNRPLETKTEGKISPMGLIKNTEAILSECLKANDKHIYETGYDGNGCANVAYKMWKHSGKEKEVP